MVCFSTCTIRAQLQWLTLLFPGKICPKLHLTADFCMEAECECCTFLAGTKRGPQVYKEMCLDLSSSLIKSNKPNYQEGSFMWSRWRAAVREWKKKTLQTLKKHFSKIKIARCWGELHIILQNFTLLSSGILVFFDLSCLALRCFPRRKKCLKNHRCLIIKWLHLISLSNFITFWPSWYCCWFPPGW